jgi:hypothetical protein
MTVVDVLAQVILIERHNPSNKTSGQVAERYLAALHHAGYVVVRRDEVSTAAKDDDRRGD